MNNHNDPSTSSCMNIFFYSAVLKCHTLVPTASSFIQSHIQYLRRKEAGVLINMKVLESFDVEHDQKILNSPNQTGSTGFTLFFINRCISCFLVIAGRDVVQFCSPVITLQRTGCLFLLNHECIVCDY